jgi:hypothetical protein
LFFNYTSVSFFLSFDSKGSSNCFIWYDFHRFFQLMKICKILSVSNLISKLSERMKLIRDNNLFEVIRFNEDLHIISQKIEFHEKRSFGNIKRIAAIMKLKKVVKHHLSCFAHNNTMSRVLSFSTKVKLW